MTDPSSIRSARFRPLRRHGPLGTSAFYSEQSLGNPGGVYGWCI
jgi:hypothetical protein